MVPRRQTNQGDGDCDGGGDGDGDGDGGGDGDDGGGDGDDGGGGGIPGFGKGLHDPDSHVPRSLLDVVQNAPGDKELAKFPHAKHCLPSPHIA